MGVYGDIAVRAWHLASRGGMSPPAAWRAALGERYTDPNQLKNAAKHTCPKGAFLGLCERGLLRDIATGSYTLSVFSRDFALAAVEQLRMNPSLAESKTELEARVFGERKPNDEVDVVLTLREQRLFR